ncbi:TPA: DUF3265 domain-containing protein [Vibrio parahaemolyticus]|nr:DUF3265 domain-containing protein [Vibrio parahaemolyticus]
MTKHLSAIHNAWHFWFASNFVFKAQCGSRCVLRCSRLNAALVRDWHQRLKVLVFIGFVFELFTGSNVPFMFFPVALYAECSL